MRIGQVDTVAEKQIADRIAILPQLPFNLHQGGVLHKDLNDRTTTNTAAEVIKTIQLPAGALKDGSGLRLSIAGVTAVNANNKLVTVVLGTTEIYNSAVVAANNKPWNAIVEIHRVSQSVQRCFAHSARFGGAIVADQYNQATENCAAALNLSVKVTDATAAAGTTMKVCVLELLSGAPAAA